MLRLRKSQWSHVTHLECINFLCTLYRVVSMNPHKLRRTHSRARTPMHKPAHRTTPLNFLLRNRAKLMQGVRLTFRCTMDLHVPLLYRSPMPIHGYFGRHNHFADSNCCALLDEYRYISGVHAPHDRDGPPKLQTFLPTLRDAVYFGAAICPSMLYSSFPHTGTTHRRKCMPCPSHTIVGHWQPRSSPHEMILVVVQNATAAEAWPMCQAHGTGHLHPTLARMRMSPTTLPRHLSLTRIPDMYEHARLSPTVCTLPNISLTAHRNAGGGHYSGTAFPTGEDPWRRCEPPRRQHR